MGVGSILQCKKIILLANGKAKQDAVYGSSNGIVTTMVPGSLLQLHRDVTFFVDKDAAAKLS